MPAQPYATDGDQGFIGLNSRENPNTLQQGFVTKSQNFRLNRGIAEVRKGTKRYTFSSLVGQTVFGTCVYVGSNGAEQFVLVVSDGLYLYNPDTDIASAKVPFPVNETITSSDFVEVYQATGNGYVYITRGFNKTVLRWDGNIGAGNIVVPSNITHHNYPNSKTAIYYGNRHIVQIDNNTIRVSHYLEDNKWSTLDMFSINDGSNDRLVAITPWTLNEFVIFMRNSIFYASVGVGAYLLSDPATEDNSYVKSLATDIGCLARKSIVQAGGGIIFLSDNGVYILQPAAANGPSQSAPEGMRLLTMAEPLSAPIDDIIRRINQNYASESVGIYWENRYYLAVPLDNSTTNNAILVFNFINKSWESVDVYPAGFDVLRFLIAKKNDKRRMWTIDSNEGIFLMEELNYDEYGTAVGTPLLDDPLCLLDSEGCRFSPSSFKSNAINAELITRAYTFQTSGDKRFSSVQSDVNVPAFGHIDIDFITTNPDTVTRLFEFAPNENEDYILRLPCRKIAYSSQVKYSITSYRPSIRSVSVDAILVGHNIHTKP